MSATGVAHNSLSLEAYTHVPGAQVEFTPEKFEVFTGQVALYLARAGDADAFIKLAAKINENYLGLSPSHVPNQAFDKRGTPNDVARNCKIWQPKDGVCLPEPERVVGALIDTTVTLPRGQQVVEKYGVVLWAISMEEPKAAIVGKAKNKNGMQRRFGAIVATDQPRQKVPVYYSDAWYDENFKLDDALAANLKKPSKD